MTAKEPSILRQLRALGVHVVIASGRVKARGATSRVTAAHFAMLRQQRAQVLAWLTSPRPPTEVIPFVTKLFGDSSPVDLDWALYFDSYPDELGRLAKPVAGPAKLPIGRRTTARDWARYLASHPDVFAELVTRARARLAEVTDTPNDSSNGTAPDVEPGHNSRVTQRCYAAGDGGAGDAAAPFFGRHS